jgi:hypothetical protein
MGLIHIRDQDAMYIYLVHSTKMRYADRNTGPAIWASKSCLGRPCMAGTGAGLRPDDSPEPGSLLATGQSGSHRTYQTRGDCDDSVSFTLIPYLEPRISGRWDQLPPLHATFHNSARPLNYSQPYIVTELTQSTVSTCTSFVHKPATRIATIAT